MQQDSSSTAELARGIGCSKWTRWAGRPAPSATAQRQIEARAQSDRKGSAGRGKIEKAPGGEGGPRVDYSDVSLFSRFGHHFEPRRAVCASPETSRNRKENEQLTNVPRGQHSPHDRWPWIIYQPATSPSWYFDCLSSPIGRHDIPGCEDLS
jgi:hypothetical protein